MKRILLSSLLMMLLIVSGASAAWQLLPSMGTTVNTLVINYKVTANYTSGPFEIAHMATSSALSQVTVNQIYGFDLDPEAITNNGIEPLAPRNVASYNYVVRNVGNTDATDAIGLSTANRTIDGSFVIWSSPTANLAYGAQTTLYIVVTANADATPNAFVAITTNITVNGIGSGPEYYLGYNNRYYGGYRGWTQGTLTWIKQAIMVVNKTYEVHFPAEWNGPTLQTRPVPGCTITFNISYRNIGSTTANDIVLEDTVPTVSSTGAQLTSFRLNSSGHVCTDGAVTINFAYAATDNAAWTYTPAAAVPGDNWDKKVGKIQISLAPIGINVQGTANYAVIVE